MTTIRKQYDRLGDGERYYGGGYVPLPKGSTPGNATPGKSVGKDVYETLFPDKKQGKSIYLDGKIYENYCAKILDVGASTTYSAWYECLPTHNFTNYQEVVLGKDYVKQWQWRHGDGWAECNQKEYDKTVPANRRIIALPIQADKQEGEKETPEKIAQWVIDNRYPKREYNGMNNFELYHILVDKIKELITNKR